MYNDAHHPAWSSTSTTSEGSVGVPKRPALGSHSGAGRLASLPGRPAGDGPQLVRGPVPLVPTTARSTGMAYNVDGIDLSPIGMVSTSNSTVDPQIQVWIDSGVALIVFPREILETVLDQWPDR